MNIPIDISELLARRADLSTFVVHLTKDTEDRRSARNNLRRILKTRTLEARSPFGPAGNKSLSRKDRETQKCVSFSETPLEYIDCLTQEIHGRKIRLSSYGLAFTKMTARQKGVNPVWYIDITPGHDWLMKPINDMVQAEKKRGTFQSSKLSLICPFIEQMGSGAKAGGTGFRKEFWWEREWRHSGDFRFFYSQVAFGLAPEDYVEEFEELSRHFSRRRIRFLDPKWSTEKMVAHLCGCTGALTPFDPA
jgi:Putative abortive phage resistance protein AbiGi, antitoxin